MNKKYLYWALPLFLVLLFLPQILSTPLFKPLFIKAAEQKLKGHVTIETVSLSWLGPQTFKNVDFVNRDIDAKIEVLQSPVPLWKIKKMNGLLTLQNGSFAFPAHPGALIEQVNGTLKNSEFSLTGKTQVGSQVGHIQLSGLYQSATNFNLKFDITELPSAILAPFFKKADWLIGDRLSLSGTLEQKNKEGTLQTQISSPNLQTNLSARLQPDGLTLDSPLTLRCSPSLPFLASRPSITLSIDSKGFFLPIPFSLKTCKIAQAILNPGKFYAKAQGSLKSLLSLTKPGSYREGSPVEIWTTPVDLQLNDQTLYVGRIDALIAGFLHVCSWGIVDLNKGKYDLSLGLPADTLRRVFSIQNLPENYVLKIPIKGTLDNPTLVTGPAVAKIAALVAGEQMPPAKGLVKDLIQAVISSKEEQAPPAKRPFPWE